MNIFSQMKRFSHGYLCLCGIYKGGDFFQNFAQVLITICRPLHMYSKFTGFKINVINNVHMS